MGDYEQHVKYQNELNLMCSAPSSKHDESEMWCKIIELIDYG